MKSSVPFFQNYIEPWLKLQIFRSLARYNIIEFTAIRLKEDPYYRSFCKIADKEQKLYFEGMAEGPSILNAKLKALAEAYERSCLRAYFGSSNFPMGGGYPYGVGVGFREASAVKRAYGEYYERSFLGQSDNRGPLTLLLNGSHSQAIDTPVGPVFIHFIKSEGVLTGSGYGFTAKEAEDSALRSALRKRDFFQKTPTFLPTNIKPKQIRLTPQKSGWLECFYIGH